MANNGMIKLTGLWRKETEKGVHYSGSLGFGANLLLFKNEFKKSEKDPDLLLYIAAKSKKKGQEGKEEPEKDEFPF